MELVVSAGSAWALTLVLLAATGADPGVKTLAELTESLRTTAIAFAQTMADRDHDAFIAFLDGEAIFFSGDEEIRGRDAVAAAWADYFEGDAPPFSWEPTVVSVLDSGELGLTSGPVLDPEGNRFATFSSVWRRTSDGRWLIVLDRGYRWCD